MIFCWTQKVWIYFGWINLDESHFLKQNHELSPAESLPCRFAKRHLRRLTPPPKKKQQAYPTKTQGFNKKNWIMPAHTDLSLVMWGQDYVEAKWCIQYALLRLWASEIPTILPQQILKISISLLAQGSFVHMFAICDVMKLNDKWPIHLHYP